MVSARERILIVENDPGISDLIGRQALQAAGFQTLVVADAHSAISAALQFSPDLIIVDLNLSGLSGKDLLVAFSSQGIETPVIILAPKGNETEMVQTFRVGASDFLIWPVRETEVINAVERVLRQVRGRRERDNMAQQFQVINKELQQRVRELVTIFGVGKAVLSITDQTVLFDKLLQETSKVTQADMGWFLLLDETTKAYLLVAQYNLPPSFPARMNQPWDDGMSSLVALSGEALSIHGDPIKRFKISGLGQAALIVPIKVQSQVIGLLVMVRKQPEPFKDSEQHLMEAVADYASISLVNARLFRALEERAHIQQTMAENAQMGEKVTNALMQAIKQELRPELENAQTVLDRLAKDPTLTANSYTHEQIVALQEGLSTLARITESIRPVQPMRFNLPAGQCALDEIVKQSVKLYLPHAQQCNVTLTSDIPEIPVVVRADNMLLASAINALLRFAICDCKQGGQASITLGKTHDNQAQVIVNDSGEGYSLQQVAHFFERDYLSEQVISHHFGGLGMGLDLVEEVVKKQKGRIWVESDPDHGTSIHLSFIAVA
jgi:DNA-binding response OmpR family regulator